MATQSPNLQLDNLITGKILLKETGQGLPDLVVVIKDMDPGAKSDESFGSSGTPSATTQPSTEPFPGDRLGSVASAKDGTWVLSFNDAEFRILNAGEKRPDLLLMVLGPEDADSDKPPVVLFSSKLLRINSGRMESYVIRLTKKQLIEAEIQLPADEDENNSTERKIQKFRKKKTAQKALKEGIKEINTEFEIADTPQFTELKKVFKAAILPNASVTNSLYNFVKDTDSIHTVQQQVFNVGSNTIDRIINTNDPDNPIPGKGIRINLILTDGHHQISQTVQYLHLSSKRLGKIVNPYDALMQNEAL